MSNILKHQAEHHAKHRAAFVTAIRGGGSGFAVVKTNDKSGRCGTVVSDHCDNVTYASLVRPERDGAIIFCCRMLSRVPWTIQPYVWGLWPRH